MMKYLYGHVTLNKDDIENKNGGIVEYMKGYPQREKEMFELIKDDISKYLFGDKEFDGVGIA